MDYIITMSDGSAYLAHHGVKGMHWGVWNSETAAKYAGKADIARKKGNNYKADKLERKAIAKEYKREVRQGGKNAVAASSKAINIASLEAAGISATAAGIKTLANPLAMGISAVGGFTLTQAYNRAAIYSAGKRATEDSIREALKAGKKPKTVEQMKDELETTKRNQAYQDAYKKEERRASRMSDKKLVANTAKRERQVGKARSEGYSRSVKGSEADARADASRDISKKRTSNQPETSFDYTKAVASRSDSRMSKEDSVKYYGESAAKTYQSVYESERKALRTKYKSGSDAFRNEMDKRLADHEWDSDFGTSEKAAKSDARYDAILDHEKELAQKKAVRKTGTGIGRV